VRPVVDRGTREKISIFSGDAAEWLPEMERYIAPEQIPCFLGGGPALRYKSL
jgi:hypothetical protein